MWAPYRVGIAAAMIGSVAAAVFVAAACKTNNITAIDNNSGPDGETFGSADGSVTISPSSLAFSGVNCGSAGMARSLTITNTTEVAVTWQATLADSTDHQFTIMPASGTIAAGSQQTVVVTPAPVPDDAGFPVYQDHLLVTTSALDAGEQVALQETTRGAIVVVSPPAIDFGKVALGSVADASIVVQNQGDYAASLSLQAGPGFAFSPASASVPPDASITIGVSFAPVNFGDAGAQVVVTPQVSCGAEPTLALGGQGFGEATSLGVSRHTCAILSSGELACWGPNDYGQLGQGTTGPPIPTPTVVSALPAGHKVVDVGLGYGFTCAVLDVGSVYCWGQNDIAELGNGASLDGGLPSIPTPTQVVGVAGATAIAVGSDHACVLLGGDGGTAVSIACWGDDNLGQLGDGNNPNGASSTAGPLVFGSAGTFTAAPVAIAAGSDQSCAVLADGTAWCWGANGTGMGVSRNPTPVTTLQNIAQLSVGNNTLCALQAGANVPLLCWGRDQFGQVGDGDFLDAGFEDVAQVLSPVSQVSTGGSHTCALTYGKVNCWGDNASGDLGLGSTTTSAYASPQVVTAVFTASEVKVAFSYTCARLPSGSVSCWGDNSLGQLGIGTVASADAGSTSVPTPTGVAGF